jgi:hypothetical protein
MSVPKARPCSVSVDDAGMVLEKTFFLGMRFSTTPTKNTVQIIITMQWT